MPDEENKQDDINTNEPENQPVQNNDAPPASMNIPKDVPQEQIPPPRSNVSKKTVVKKLLIVLAVLVIIAGAAFAAWKFVIDKKDQTNPAKNNQYQTAAAEKKETVDIGASELTETFKSDFLMLEFKYPEAWKATETENIILVKSPSFKIEDKSGNESIVYFKVYIKRGANDSDGKYLANAYAIEQSQKISYSEPASGQRKDTNLTNFGNQTPDNFAFFVVQGNFNLAKGDTLGPKFAQEPDSFLIAGGFANDEMQDGLATKTVAADVFADKPAYMTAVEIVKSLKLK